MAQHPTPDEAVQFLLKGVAPERQSELDQLWQDYSPQIQLVEDGPGGDFQIQGGLFRIIRFTPRVMRLFWLGAYIAWEGFDALNKALNDEGTNYDRFRDMIDVFQKILDAEDSYSIPLPEGVPEPGVLPDEPERRAPAELAMFCAGWALLHEFRHIKHQQDGTSAGYGASPEDARAEETSCDEYATDFILEQVQAYAAAQSVPEEKVRLKREIGIYFALFTMVLVAKDQWEETDNHPAMQQRIAAIRKRMRGQERTQADAIAYGAFVTLWQFWPDAPGPFKA